MHWKVLHRGHSQGMNDMSKLSSCFVLSLQEWLKELLKTHKWHLVEDQDLTYKTLPVSRPRVDLQFTFSSAKSTSEE